MNGSVVGLIVLVGAVIWGTGLWVLVLTVRFLISGRKAFDRYMFMTSDPIRPATPVLPPPGRKH